jgi:chemotaxis protein MotB
VQTSAQPAYREPSPPTADAIAELQTFRVSWNKRADQLESRLVELAEAAAVQQERIALRRQQQEAIRQERERLSEELAEKTVEQRQLVAQLAEEQARRAQLEAEIAAQREQREAELYAARESYQRLIADLQTEITRKDVAIHEFTDQLSISIVDRVLFPSGQASLTPEGMQILEKVGQVLASRTDRRIQIEGHTDDQEIGPELKKRFASNWELSTARATEVVRYLLARTTLSAERLLAVGRADTMPVAPNTTELGRQQNRRIEIILLPPEKGNRTVQGGQGRLS